MDGSTIVCWSCLSGCCWLRKYSKFGVCARLNIKFVVADVGINGTVVVFIRFWLDKNMWRDKRELKSSDDDVGEKPIDWENCEANDDGERQLVNEELVSLSFDECVISIGADWNGRWFGASE